MRKFAYWDNNEAFRTQFIFAIVALVLIAALCGGPLATVDFLAPALGRRIAFLIGMAPALLIFHGMWVIFWSWQQTGRFWVYAGGVGAAILTLMNVATIYWMAIGSNRANRGLLSFGIVVGTIAVVLYAREARSFFRGT